jgi:hypothetical protein
MNQVSQLWRLLLELFRNTLCRARHLADRVRAGAKLGIEQAFRLIRNGSRRV